MKCDDRHKGCGAAAKHQSGMRWRTGSYLFAWFFRRVVARWHVTIAIVAADVLLSHYGNKETNAHHDQSKNVIWTNGAQPNIDFSSFNMDSSWTKQEKYKVTYL
jgi:hypothetical protein